MTETRRVKTLAWALRRIEGGTAVRRKSWPVHQWVLLDGNDKFVARIGDEVVSWRPTADDAAAEDWCVA